MSEKFYSLEMKNISVGDILCYRFNAEDKYLVLADGLEISLLELFSGHVLHPTPMDVLNNFLKVEDE
jgi:hypothetical protein